MDERNRKTARTVSIVLEVIAFITLAVGVLLAVFVLGFTPRCYSIGSSVVTSCSTARSIVPALTFLVGGVIAWALFEWMAIMLRATVATAVASTQPLARDPASP